MKIMLEDNLDRKNMRQALKLNANLNGDNNCYYQLTKNNRIMKMTNQYNNPLID